MPRRQAEHPQSDVRAVACRLRVEHVLSPEARSFEALPLVSGQGRADVGIQTRFVPGVQRRWQCETVLYQQHVVAVRSVSDEYFLSRLVCPRRGEREEPVVKGGGAVSLGGVIEKIRHGLQRHMVFLGQFVRLAIRMVKGSSVHQQPVVQILIFLELWICRLHKSPVLVELFLLSCKQDLGSWRQQRSQLGRPTYGQAGGNVPPRGKDGAPFVKFRAGLQTEGSSKDGVDSGAAELLGDVLGSVAEGAQSRYGDFENDFAGLYFGQHSIRARRQA